MAKKRKSVPIKGQSYLERQQERQEAMMHIVQMWSFQLSLDILAGALNEEFGFGSERLTRLGNKFNELLPDYVKAIQKGPESDYYRDLIERQQEQIFGPDRLKWAERYEYWSGD